MSVVKKYLAVKKTGIPFQYVSDLHLEVGDQYSSFNIPASAPFLILAGDIGRLIDYSRYLEFLASQTRVFDKVFLVLGNHEFYGLSHERGLEQAAQLESEPVLEGKLVLLDQRRYEMENKSLVILGCTLWSHIPTDSENVIQHRINDFRHITDWSIQSHNQAHLSDLSWMRREMERIHSDHVSQPKPPVIVVVTHHAPSIQGTSRPDLTESPLTPAFATDLLNKGAELSRANYWIFGHTHFSMQMKKHGVMVVSNQRGYMFPGNSSLVQGYVPPGTGLSNILNWLKWQQPSKEFNASRILLT